MAFQADAFQLDAFQIGAGAPAVTGPTSAVPNTPTTRKQMGGALTDMLLDPITLDYVDDGEGGWVETADSRTMVMIQIEKELGRSVTAPGDGTMIREWFANGDPVTPDLVEAEVTRTMRLLERDGILTDFAMQIADENGADLVDGDGRFTPQLSWTDRATGNPVDLTYAPFEGG